jgi:hypothetical protein
MEPTIIYISIAHEACSSYGELIVNWSSSSAREYGYPEWTDTHIFPLFLNLAVARVAREASECQLSAGVLCSRGSVIKMGSVLTAVVNTHIRAVIGKAPVLQGRERVNTMD